MSYLLRLFFCTVLFVSGSVAVADMDKNKVELYVYPPSRPLNWESPGKLIESFLRIYRKKLTRAALSDTIYSVSPYGEMTEISEKYLSTMGHTIARTSCTTTGGDVFESWSSFSGQDYAEADKQLILEKQVGFGVLFHDFIDGHIITGEENINRLIYYRGWDYPSSGILSDLDYFDILSERRFFKPRYMSMTVTPEKCDELKKMIQFFGNERFKFKAGTPFEQLTKRHQERPNDTIYFTNTMDPLESYTARLKDPDAPVGGGCAPYGVSMVKLAGYHSDFLDDIFRLKVNVSKKWMHDPADKETSKEPVSLEGILFNTFIPGSHEWVQEPYKNRVFDQYDPQLIWDFIGEVKTCLGQPIREFEDTPCTPRAKAWLEEQKDSKVKVSSGEVIKYSKERLDDEIAGNIPKVVTGGEKVIDTIEIEGIALEK